MGNREESGGMGWKWGLNLLGFFLVVLGMSGRVNGNIIGGGGHCGSCQARVHGRGDHIISEFIGRGVLLATTRLRSFHTKLPECTTAVRL